MPDFFKKDRDLFLAQTAHLWEALRGERIFITGGTGFIGCWLLESFAWANDEFGLGASTTVLTRDPAAFQRKAPRLAFHPSIQLLAGDVRTFDFPTGSFRYLIHAATDANPQSAAGAPMETLETIVDGTRRTLEFSRHHGVEKYLLTSSGAVYGTQPAGISHIPETYSGSPDSTRSGSVYGQGKRLAELLCAIYTAHYGISCKIARCFAFAGPYLPADGHFAFGSFVRDAVQGLPIQINGDGTPVRSYLYARDLAVWLWTILLRGTPGTAYNVGSELEVTIGELANEVSGILSPNLPIQIAQTAQPGKQPLRYVPSTRLAREELSLRQYADRRETILQTAAWYRQSLTMRCQ